jgi:hypothetical protein
MSKHTPEPWYVVNGEYIYRRPQKELYEFGGQVAGDKPLAICNKGWYDQDSDGFPLRANAERIVACVNACAGMEDPQSEIQQLRSERDELMKALERICNCDESTDFGKAIDHCISTLNRMKEAGR